MRMVLVQLWFYLSTLSKPKQYGRGHGLLMAMFLLTICLFRPHLTLPKPVFDWLIVVDVTQSMNARDYTLNDKGMSRIEFAKHSIRNTLRTLPCGSTVALAMFAERNTLNIVRPVEVCEHYATLAQTVAKMEWRMAWAADSFIAHGLYSAVELAAKLQNKPHVVFLTDGHQAPPANPQYMPHFVGKVGEVKGIVVGVGQTQPVRIPKLDDRDEIAGYWEPEDVQQYGSFGMTETLSVLAMEQGQHDRNAGHGPGAEFLANAHLSALEERNLQRVAKETGMDYLKLETPQQLASAMNGLLMSRARVADTDLRPWFAIPAMLLVLFYVLATFNYQDWKQRLWQRYIAMVDIFKRFKNSQEKT